jgi:hypothetical protein
VTEFEESMASLAIARDSGYADRLRAYQIVLDGERIGEIRDGEIKEFSIPSGKHTLSLKIDWCGSENVGFVMDSAEKLAFQVKSNLRGLRLFLSLWYVLFARRSYLRLERTSSQT